MRQDGNRHEPAEGGAGLKRAADGKAIQKTVDRQSQRGKGTESDMVVVVMGRVMMGVKIVRVMIGEIRIAKAMIGRRRLFGVALLVTGGPQMYKKIEAVIQQKSQTAKQENFFGRSGAGLPSHFQCFGQQIEQGGGD